MARLCTLWLCLAAMASMAAASAQRYPATQYPIYYAHTQPPPQAALPPQVTGYSGYSGAWRPSEQQAYTPQQQQQYYEQYYQPQQPVALALERSAGPAPAQQGQQAVQLQPLPPAVPGQQPLTPEQVALREAQTQQEWTQTVDNIIARGVLELSLSLAKAVEEDGDLAGQVSNVVFSPVNVASALALVLAGSNGTTFSEIAKVLGIATGVNVLSNRERVHREFGRFLNQLETNSALVKAGNTSSGGNQVIFANGLFVQNEYNIQQQFAGIAQAYRSQVIPVEFAREPGRTKDRINNWFSEHTMGRIRSVLSEAPPTDTKLMIASALFFNGAWEAPFPSEATMTRPFYGASPNGSLEAFAVRMMTNNMDLPYAADRALGCRLLELPYKGRDVSMFLVLPDAQGVDELRALERRLNSDVLEQLIASRKDAPVIYSVPRMKLERSISLRTALETLGVRSLFDENLADLTLLSDSVVQRSPVPAAAPASQASHAAPAAGGAAGGAGHAAGPAPPPAASTPSVAAPAAQAKPPKPTTRRPAGENSIGTSNGENLYFSSRLSELAANNSVQPEGHPDGQPIVDRWGAPQQQLAARLYADDVLHKVEVEVTETGTVASAATAITISRDGSNHVMRFNRPFLFFIRHNATKLVLFYGSVVRPMPDWIVPGVDVSKLPPQRPSTAQGGNNRRPPPPAASSSSQGAQQGSQGRRPAPARHPVDATTPRAGANG
ncbi:serine protease inhibitor 28Dc-like [Thrips palmi]|uniref:Serine protease inhibitor 28Dc-like n=1 Tax=Thrips palmi TaxID=161013 RepID=A0A6P9ACU0_THRPL|nr:serine protease inhibitor 28Dc-like [Thrips palmi]